MRDDQTATARRVYASVERFFSLPAGSVGPETTAEQVEAWDSVSHVGLILAIEEEYGVVFDVAAVGEFSNLGELAAACSRLAGPGVEAPEPPSAAAVQTPAPTAAPPPAEPAKPEGFLAKLRNLFR